MSLNPVFSLLGRRLRLAVIGGGPGSFIGAMHRLAAAMSHHPEGIFHFELLALKQDPFCSRRKQEEAL